MATATPTPTRTNTVDDELRRLATPEKAETREALGGRFWGVLRLSVGWVFLWAFLDKLLALGFASGRNPETGVVDRFGDSAWINGGSPTDGFLQHGLHTKAPFADFYASLAGSAVIEWIYMLSMAAHRHRADPRHRDAAGRRRRHRLDGDLLHRVGDLAREQPVPRRAHRLRDRPGRHRLRGRRPLPGPGPALGAPGPGQALPRPPVAHDGARPGATRGTGGALRGLVVVLRS